MQNERAYSLPLAEALAVTPGITAVIGGGGKTTLLRKLGEALSCAGHTVILATTTKIRAFNDVPGGNLASLDTVRTLARQERLIWVASEAEGGKWGPAQLSVEEMASAAEYVLVEADGSAGQPMKAHRPFEPVIPKETRQVIAVLGAHGFGQRIAETAHCPSLYAQYGSCTVDDLLTPQIAARVLKKEKLHDRVLVNQAETAAQLDAARCLAADLREPVCAGALLSKKWDGNLCLLS